MPDPVMEAFKAAIKPEMTLDEYVWIGGVLTSCSECTQARLQLWRGARDWQCYHCKGPASWENGVLFGYGDTCNPVDIEVVTDTLQCQDNGCRRRWHATHNRQDTLTALKLVVPERTVNVDMTHKPVRLFYVKDR